MIFVRVLSFFIKLFGRISHHSNIFFLNRIVTYLKVKKEKKIFDMLGALNYSGTPNFQSEVLSSRVASCRNIVWTAWFQGLEYAPELVKKCVTSFTKLNCDEVIVITESNYSDYVTIDESIISKFNAGVINYTSFSEIIRLQLLSTYGGFWIDSTVFIRNACFESVNQTSFLSLKSSDEFKDGDPLGVIPVFFLYTNRNYHYISLVRDLFFSYWSKYDSLVDYFLIDYCFKYVSVIYPGFKSDIKKMPIIGKQRYLLDFLFDQEANDINLSKLNEDPCGIYKLSNKKDYSLITPSAKETLYSKFINNEDFFR